MTDTSKEAVERLAQDLEDNAEIDAAEGGNPRVVEMEERAAATLRALLAERDALRAEADGHVLRIEFVRERAKLAEAERDSIAAAAFEAAADEAEEHKAFGKGIECCANCIRALTPDNALAHLKAIEAKAEARGMREAAACALEHTHAVEPKEIAKSILALADEREKGAGHD